MHDLRRWQRLLEDDEFDYDEDEPVVPAKPTPPLQFLRMLNKHQQQRDRTAWRGKQRKRYRREEQMMDDDRTRHVPKSQVGYKPFQPMIRFGKFRDRSKIFLDPELRAEMGNVTHESGVSCFQAMPHRDGFLVLPPLSDRAVYHNSDPFQIILGIIERQVLPYLDQQQPMDIFLVRGHLAAFGKNNEWLSLGSDGEYLLDTRKPYKQAMIAPEQVYMNERMNLLQWFDAAYHRGGGIAQLRRNTEAEEQEV